MDKKKPALLSAEQQARQTQIQQMFNSIANRYDALNDWLSLGMHRRWKNALAKKAAPKNEELLIDLACGTGDIALRFKSTACRLVLVDPSLPMLQKAQQRFAKQRFAKQPSPAFEKQVLFVQATGEHLPLHNNSVDKLCIAFGVRNAANLDQMIEEIHRVLHHSGHWFCLEFFRPTQFWGRLLSTVLFAPLTLVGGLLSLHPTAYRYLFSSIRAFHSQKEWCQKLAQHGFEEVGCQTFLGGIVCLFSAKKAL